MRRRLCACGQEMLQGCHILFRVCWTDSGVASTALCFLTVLSNRGRSTEWILLENSLMHIPSALAG